MADALLPAHAAAAAKLLDLINAAYDMHDSQAGLLPMAAKEHGHWASQGACIGLKYFRAWGPVGMCCFWRWVKQQMQ